MRMDAFGRTIDYLRISVTDQCNQRCLYCRPPGYGSWELPPDYLTAAEIVCVARVAAGLGFRKFRLTGGEPLLRGDLINIVQELAGLPGIRGLGLSTNGTRLTALARPLRAAGLRSVNVSLDALDANIYRRITGGDIGSVLAGLRAAEAAGFECLKLNCVLLRGVNESQIWPLVLFAAEHGFPLRLIELMPLASAGQFQESSFLSVGEAMRQLEQRDELIPDAGDLPGWGPARYYRLRRTGVRVGFIGALSECRFCAGCNKLRLTADGQLRPCLGHVGEVDVRAALRGATDDDAVRHRLQTALRQKPFEHELRTGPKQGRPMIAVGG